LEKQSVPPFWCNILKQITGNRYNLVTCIIQTVIKLKHGQIIRSAILKHTVTIGSIPHQSARAENIQIRLDDFQLPETQNTLIVEGAGGLMVPLSDNRFMIDLIKKLQLPAALVVII
jgi:dethiobiotin synthetase